MAGLSGFAAIGAVSILELAANSRSSRMSQAPNLHLAMQLLTTFSATIITVVVSLLLT